MSKTATVFGKSKKTNYIDTSTATALNKDGGSYVWRRSDGEQVLQVLLTGTLSNTYYATQKEQLEEAQSLFKNAVTQDPAFFSKALIYAREQGYMRMLPVYGLYLLSTAPKPYFEDAFGHVIRTPNDLKDFYVHLEANGRGRGGRRVKRVISNWLKDRLTEYWVIKYGSDTHKSSEKTSTHSLANIIKAAHPNYGHQDPLIAYLLGKGGWATFGDSQLSNFERLKNATTERERAEYITAGRLPWNVASTFGSKLDSSGKVVTKRVYNKWQKKTEDKAVLSPTVWAAIIPNMPLFNLLKNLSALEEDGILEQNFEVIKAKFTNPAILEGSMILPHRFLDAEGAVKNPRTKDLLRQSLELAFKNVPDIEGRTAFFMDVSPSMKPKGVSRYGSDKLGEFSRVSAVLGIALMKKTNMNGRFIMFGGTAEELEVYSSDSILTQAQKVVEKEIGSTNHSAGFELLIAKQDRVDNIILITDGEHNTGRTFAEGLNAYKRNMNPNVKVFVIDVSPHRDAVLPQDAQNAYTCYGWSDRVLKFISLASKGYGGLEDYVRNTYSPQPLRSKGPNAQDSEGSEVSEIYSSDVLA